MLEVILFNENHYVQLVFSIVEYLFVLFLLFYDYKLAINYFISFSLLSFGAWTYVIDEILPSNFWGLRFFGVSVNLLTTVFIFIFLIFKEKKFKISEFNFEFNILIIYFLFSFFIGLAYVLLGVNYFDNFTKDFSIFFPIFFYIYILSKVDPNNCLLFFKKCIPVTLISMLFSLLLGKYFEYGSGLKFILINGFGYIIIFIVPFCSKLYTKNIFRLLVFTCIILLVSGKMFIGGKFIINIFITILWYFIFYKKQFKLAFIFLITLISVILLWTPISEGLMLFFADNLLIQNKLSQVISLVNILDLELISASPTSIGNIIAEGRSVFIYFIKNPFIAFTGLGFGGGIPDYYGYLSPLAQPGMGYNEIDASRDLFFRLHLPIYEILLKTGLIGLCIYVYIIAKNFLKQNVFSFFFTLMFLTIFSNNKEMILLSLFFIRISDLDFKNKSLI